ncbi:universal stress protein [Roseimaritima ulvae]|uniref:UspA domain-containing protein n=1 Tax=Roseimaritima ulvae TaxID=980254 RepID=A0A5B9QNH4_9BACT|nr:universal stress protein [Roseimaritima ulvae]QEG40568.1 hypothetical protein UC8_25830 [Roseimaritima ulvae]
MKKIVVATDGSQAAEDAARFLSHIPHEETIELTVVTALFVPGSHRTYLGGDWIKTCMQRERESADAAFARIEALFEGANVVLKHVTREGHPAETVVAVARELQPELLVLGATGHSTISRILLGSTSDYVATHCPCSVLVVRRTGVMENQHPLRVAIAFEPSEPAQAALEEFAEFRWGADTDVSVVSAVYQPGFYQSGPEALSSAPVDEAAQRLNAVAPRATGVLIPSEHMGEGLVQYVESKQMDLVVVGETPRTRLGRILLGSVTRFLLRHAACSVWITRNRMVQSLPTSSPAASQDQPLPLV